MTPDLNDVSAPVFALGVIAFGAALGVFGAWRNRAGTALERAAWAAGGAIGATCVGALGPWIALAQVAPSRPVTAGLVGAWGVLSALASIATPVLDDAPGMAAGATSFALKWLMAPLTTSVGVLAAIVRAASGRSVRFRRGTLFFDAGAGRRAVALGGVVWTQRGWFAAGALPDGFARHEAYHTRTAAALGEWGFYVAYLALGAPLAARRGAPWNAVGEDGRGNPFEETAYRNGAEPTGSQAARASRRGAAPTPPRS